MTDSVVGARGITKMYKMGEIEVEALAGASLTIQRGESWRSWAHRALASPP